VDVSSLGRRRCLAILDIVELSVSEMRPPPSASSEYANKYMSSRDDISCCGRTFLVSIGRGEYFKNTVCVCVVAFFDLVRR
jgi:hypothetical protein